MIRKMEPAGQVRGVGFGVMLKVDTDECHQFQKDVGEGDGLGEEAELVPEVRARLTHVLLTVLGDQPHKQTHLCHDERTQL